MLLNFELRFACLLVYANKMDLPHSLGADEISREVRSIPGAKATSCQSLSLNTLLCLACSRCD